MAQLRRDAQTLLRQLTLDFQRDLEARSSEWLTQSLSQWQSTAASFASPTLSAGGLGWVGSAGALLQSGLRVFTSRPRTITTSEQTARSADAAVAFRVSQSESANELARLIARGDKNA